MEAAFSAGGTPDGGRGTNELPLHIMKKNLEFIRSHFAALVAAWLLVSAPATLAQSGPCFITQQPQDRTICADAGGANRFTLSASIDQTSTWRLWKQPLGGGTETAVASSDIPTLTANHTILGVATSESGHYYFEFTRALLPRCDTYTDFAVIRVLSTGPRRLNSPQSDTACAGSTATFTATATGDAATATYVWTKNGVALNNTARITGATGSGLSATLTIADVRASDAADYRCTWGTASCGTTSESLPATLTYHGPIVIHDQPDDFVTCVGLGMAMGCQANYTNSASLNVTTEPSYQWQKQAANGTWSDRAGATSFLLEINPLVAGDAGNYRCKLTSPSCAVVYSNPARLTLGPPILVTQPMDTNGCPGSTVTFSVVATNTTMNTTYLWRKSVNSTFVNITATNVLGKNTPTLTITDLGTNDVTRYLCTVQNLANGGGCANSVNASTVTLTLNPGPPVIVTNPAPITVPAGGTATYRVAATGTGLTYEWRRANGSVVTDGTYANGTVVSGATTPTLRFERIADADVGSNYRVVVRNACGSDTSPLVSFTVNGCPWITTSPVSLSRCRGESATFSLAAVGTPALAYRWRLNGTHLPGATNDTVFIASVATADAGFYDCVLSNTCGTATSAPVTLTIAGAIITEQPKAWLDCGDSDFFARFDVTATTSTPPLTYLWRRNGTNLVNGTNAFGTTVEGANSASLRLTGGTGYRQNEGDFQCVITDGSGCAVMSDTVPLIIGRITFTAAPVSQQVCTGATVTFSMAQVGAPSPFYSWKRGSTFLTDGSGISGAKSPTLTLTGVTDADEGNYSCQVNAACGNSLIRTSPSASLKVFSTSPAITVPPQNLFLCATSGAPATFTVTASEAGTYQWRKGSAPIVGATNSSFTIAMTALADVGGYDCVVSNFCFGSVTSAPAFLNFVSPDFAITQPPTPATVCVGDTVAFTIVATGERLTYQWQKGNSDIAGATTTTLTLTNIAAGAAANYRCLVANPCGSLTSAAAALTVRSGPPSFTTQPASRTRCLGASFTFTAVANAGPAYQWRKEGMEIPGATNGSYTIAAVTESDAGLFDCIASNPCGSTTSSVARLSFETMAPAITTQPRSQYYHLGVPVSLTVEHTGNAAYFWRKQLGGGGIALFNTATNNTFTFSSPTNNTAGNYFCIVSNACGSVTSIVAVLTLAPPLRLEGPGFTGDRFGFNLTGPTGVVVQVEASADLVNWLPAGTSILGVGTNTFLPPPASNAPALFYRGRYAP